MQKRITLVVVVLMIVAAILYLENPAWLQSLMGTASNINPEISAQLGVLDNPEGDEVGLRPGNAAPDFALSTLDGDVIRLSDFRGEKFVIVNLWASWCGPCKVEMPDLEKVHTEYDELVVLGVDLQESVEDIKKFLEEEVTVSYPILLDSEGEVASAYNLFAQPTSFLIDKHGIIYARKNGAYTPEELDEVVAAFLSDDAETSMKTESDNFEQTLQRARVINTMSDTSTSTSLPEGVKAGFINEKFFGPGEIKQLGLEIDLQQIPYRADLELDKLVMGCAVVDCIASIDGPRFETAPEAGWMQDEDMVLSLEFKGITRAYPTKILNYHEIVNDQFGDIAVAISFCPLCNSAVAFEAPVFDGEAAQFGVSGRLYFSDLIMYDRITKSMWSQIERTVIVGPLTGQAPELEFLPVSVTPWALWREQHPDGEVLSRPTTGDVMGGKPPRHTDPDEIRLTRDFDTDPYGLYHTNNVDIRFPIDIKDRRLPNKTTVIGIEVEGAYKAYPLDIVEVQGTIQDTFSDESITIIYDALSGEVSVHNADSESILSMQVYWFAWAAFHPDTELYEVN